MRLAVTGLALFAALSALAGTDRQIEQLRAVLAGVQGLKYEAVGNVILVEGEVDQPADMVRLGRVIGGLDGLWDEGKPIHVRNLARMSERARLNLATWLEKYLAPEDVKAKWVSDDLYLEGTVSNDYQADRAMEIARSLVGRAWRFPPMPMDIARGPASVPGGPMGPAPFSPPSAWPETQIIDMLRVRGRAAQRRR